LHEISTDNYLVSKWKDTREALKKECAIILEAYQNCKLLQQDIVPQEKKHYEYNEYYNNNNNNYFNRNYNSPNNNVIKNDEKRWAHFGGKAPFSYLKEQNNDNENNFLVKYVDKAKIGGLDYLNNFYKDPDVWTSPEEDPRFSYDKKYNGPRRPASQKKYKL
jgi:hypothetical protein